MRTWGASNALMISRWLTSPATRSTRWTLACTTGQRYGSTMNDPLEKQQRPPRPIGESKKIRHRHDNNPGGAGGAAPSQRVRPSGCGQGRVPQVVPPRVVSCFSPDYMGGTPGDLFFDINGAGRAASPTIDEPGRGGEGTVGGEEPPLFLYCDVFIKIHQTIKQIIAKEREINDKIQAGELPMSGGPRSPNIITFDRECPTGDACIPWHAPWLLLPDVHGIWRGAKPSEGETTGGPALSYRDQVAAIARPLLLRRLAAISGSGEPYLAGDDPGRLSFAEAMARLRTMFSRPTGAPTRYLYIEGMHLGGPYFTRMAGIEERGENMMEVVAQVMHFFSTNPSFPGASSDYLAGGLKEPLNHILVVDSGLADLEKHYNNINKHLYSMIKAAFARYYKKNNIIVTPEEGPSGTTPGSDSVASAHRISHKEHLLLLALCHFYYLDRHFTFVRGNAIFILSRLLAPAQPSVPGPTGPEGAIAEDSSLGVALDYIIMSCPKPWPNRSKSHKRTINKYLFNAAHMALRCRGEGALARHFMASGGVEQGPGSAPCNKAALDQCGFVIWTHDAPYFSFIMEQLEDAKLLCSWVKKSPNSSAFSSCRPRPGEGVSHELLLPSLYGNLHYVTVAKSRDTPIDISLLMQRYSYERQQYRTLYSKSSPNDGSHA